MKKAIFFASLAICFCSSCNMSAKRSEQVHPFRVAIPYYLGVESEFDDPVGYAKGLQAGDSVLIFRYFLKDSTGNWTLIAPSTSSLFVEGVESVEGKGFSAYAMEIRKAVVIKKGL